MSKRNLHSKTSSCLLPVARQVEAKCAPHCIKILNQCLYACLSRFNRFFSKKIGYVPEQDPNLPYVTPSFEDAVAEIDEALDVDLAASGEAPRMSDEHSLH